MSDFRLAHMKLHRDSTSYRRHGLARRSVRLGDHARAAQQRSTIYNPRPRGVGTFLAIANYPFDDSRRPRSCGTAAAELAVIGGVWDSVDAPLNGRVAPGRRVSARRYGGTEPIRAGGRYPRSRGGGEQADRGQPRCAGGTRAVALPTADGRVRDERRKPLLRPAWVSADAYRDVRRPASSRPDHQDHPQWCTFGAT
jgi:hypothetical protein